MRPFPSAVLVFATSAAVLVLEILAGRLMAPYVGVSLETFTGIIGTVLAGIAAGSAAGGWAADRHDPRRLVGPTLVAGGVLVLLSLPLVRFLGPRVGTGTAAIVTLSALTFLLPAAVLSALTPMVAKLRLDSLDDTGSVFGRLSAAGTVGALAGTFITGFVLVSAAPTNPIVLAVGGLLVVCGLALGWRLNRQGPTASGMVAVLLAGLAAGSTDSPCQHETAYFCVNVVIDDDDPAHRSLFLDRLRHAFVDLEDPGHLDIRYIRLFATVALADPDGVSHALHLGGGGFSFPRYLRHVDPAVDNTVVEIDADLVEINRRELGLVTDERLAVTVGDARLALGDMSDGRFDLVVGDAFGSHSVPWHLTTREFVAEIDRVMTADGVYVMNVLDGGQSRFARAELATLRERFAHVGVVVPSDGIPARRVNLILLASHRPLPELDIAPDDGRLFRGPIEDFIEGEKPLRDDFAPTDQLLP